MADNDDRTYIKVHDGISDHPKVDGLSDKAFRLLIDTWCWCSRHLTDGYVPQTTWLKRGSKGARRELVDAGLVLPRATGGVECHDYLSHQRSAHEVAELREKKRAAAAKGNHERWHVGPKGKPSPACPYCPKDEDVPADKPPPDLQEDPYEADRGDPETIAPAIADASQGMSHLFSEEPPLTSPETEEVLRTSQTETDPLPAGGGAGEPVADAAAPAETEKPKRGRPQQETGNAKFDEFWAIWPRKVGKADVKTIFARLAKKVDPDRIIAAAKAQADQWSDEGKEIKYIPHPKTWLNQGRYDDEIERAGLRLASRNGVATTTHSSSLNPWSDYMRAAR